MGAFPWKDKLIKKMFIELDLIPFAVDACVLALSGTQGDPVDHRWTIYTDCKEIHEAFRGCVCKEHDAHPYHVSPSLSPPMDEST